MNTTTTNQDAYDTDSTADVLALGGATAVVSAIVMLLLDVFGAIGVYEGAVEMMEQGTCSSSRLSSEPWLA